MKIFQCGNCSHPLFFENSDCENCGHLVGYNDTKRIMNSFVPTNQGMLFSDRNTDKYRYCKNEEYGVCNWLIKDDAPNDYCTACSLNRTIPNLADKTNHEKWHKLEVAKHRLIYQLQRLHLPLPSKLNVEEGLCFDFLAQTSDNEVMTGHANGIITIRLSEADSVLREQIRRELSEPYRTLIGHFRHEVGHYFWERLIAIDTSKLDEFRSIFGDERMDYGKALKSYYATGGVDNWSEHFISKYATSHPWEDWAESWAHYLHIMDITETSYYFGLEVNPNKGFSGMKGSISFDPYEADDFGRIVKDCIPVLFAVNSINRSMGIPDAYPFVINQSVIDKMTFIHQLIFKTK
ncbi:MAG: putative zinc-binding metallopeptidase [Reichenbachiella sp.]|uniref:zinc-binding metallopeptidase family protein n=1 Tax=Reichenbachiella sp. TaxID=2184521 RepID=UPI003298B71E